jgi:hypothetical protein
MNNLNEKYCIKCGELKPLSGFYARKRVGDGYMNWCKDCHKAMTYSNPLYAKDQVIEATEADVIKKLLSIGIYATPGKASAYNHVDVVAWGCVQIEVKSSTLRHKKGSQHYSFGLTPNQQLNGLRAHVVVLTCLNSNGNSYHIFPSDHEIFQINDRLRTAIVYTPTKTREYKSDIRKSLSHELMQYYQDAWGLIEVKRQQISQDLVRQYND